MTKQQVSLSNTDPEPEVHHGRNQMSPKQISPLETKRYIHIPIPRFGL